MRKIHFAWIVFTLLIFSFGCKQTKENTSKKESFVFNYLPEKPKNGKLLGIVELGAAGFNSFIINVDEDLNWELKSKEYGTSLLVEGMTNTALINEKLRSYINKIVSSGVLKKDIHFIVSSGAAKEEITEIITQELKNIGHTVNNVTALEEGAYALKANLPNKFKENSFLVDMGSGNTKISYFNTDGTTKTLETHGAKYYQKGLEDQEVYNNVRTTLAKIPASKRTKCFIIGGVPTKLARSISPKEEIYTVLNPNAESFKNLAKKEGKKVQSGLNIYKAIQEETKVKEIIYVLDGNFSVGFLLEKQK